MKWFREMGKWFLLETKKNGIVDEDIGISGFEVKDKIT